MGDTTIRAILSAKDNMSAAFSNASKAAGELKSGIGQTIKTGAAFTVGMKAMSAAMSTVSGSIGSAISRHDTLNNFPKIMKNLGISSKDAEQALEDLSDGIEGLPTTLDSAASGVQRFVSSNGDIKKSTKYFVAMNDAIVAGGQSSELQASAVEQLSQSYSKGKMDMLEWRSIQQAMPAQLKQIATAMGMTTDQLGEGLRNGTVSMDKFMDTIVELDTKGTGKFASFSEQAKTAVGGIATALSIAKTKVVKGLADMMGSIDESLTNAGLPTIGEMIGKLADGIGSAFKAISGYIAQIDLKSVVAAAKPYWDAFKGAVEKVAGWIKKLGGYLADHSETLSKLIGPLLGVVVGFKLLKSASAIAGPIKTITKSFSTLGSGLLARLAPQMVATGAAETAMGTSAGAQAGNVMKMGVACLALGAGIALACVGIALLVQGAIALAQQGGLAIAVMAGMVIAVAGLAAVFAFLGPVLDASAIGLIAFGAALVAAGFAMQLMADAVSVAAPAICDIISTLGTTLTTILQGVASVIRAVAGAISTVLTALGNTISTILGAAGEAAKAFGEAVKTGLEGVATVLQAVGEVFVSFGEGVKLVMEGVATIINSVSAGITGVLEAIADIFDSMGNAALHAGQGVELMANGIKTLVDMNFGDLVGTLLATADGLDDIGDTSDSVGSLANSLSSLAVSSKASATGLRGIVVSAVGIAAAMKSAGSATASAGRSMGSNFASGVKAGMNSAKASASAGAKAVSSALKSGVPSAKSAGQMISQGFAAGMNSCMNQVVAAARKMEEAAEKAVRAKAEIRSPSRVFAELGNYIGEGFARGIENSRAIVARASENMMSIPSGNRLAFASDGYVGGSAPIPIEVPLYIDGKQIARATARYNKAEISKIEARTNRRQGRL